MNKYIVFFIITFCPLTPEVITGVQAQVRERILRLFKRRELLAPEVVEAMCEWDHAGGFSLNADVTVPTSDRSGLERLFRYCARPIFASERLQWIEKDQRLIYRLPKPRPNGQTLLTLTPLEFLDKFALLIPPPRKHNIAIAIAASWHRTLRYAKP